MVRGGCNVISVNNEVTDVPRRIEAEQRFENMWTAAGNHQCTDG